MQYKIEDGQFGQPSRIAIKATAITPDVLEDLGLALLRDAAVRTDGDGEEESRIRRWEEYNGSRIVWAAEKAAEVAQWMRNNGIKSRKSLFGYSLLGRVKEKLPKPGDTFVVPAGIKVYTDHYAEAKGGRFNFWSQKVVVASIDFGRYGPSEGGEVIWHPGEIAWLGAANSCRWIVIEDLCDPAFGLKDYKAA
jgi:hypothetical protein